MLGKHQVDVLVVLPREHAVIPIDLPGKHRHALVSYCRSIERADPEMKKILRLQQLRENRPAIIRGVCRVVNGRCVCVAKANEARVLNSIALAWGKRKDDAFGDRLLRREGNLVIRAGQQYHLLADHRRFWIGMADFEDIDSRPEMIEGELLTEGVENLPGKVGVQAKFSKFSQKQIPFIHCRRYRTRFGHKT